MVDKLRVGIVGCGAVAVKRHIPAFKRLKNVVVQAVCDSNMDTAKEVARECRISEVYSNLSDMLSKGKVDIVDICTPPQTHASLAVGALEYGCHVLLEKPMALTTVDCDQMVEASKRYGKSLCIVHNVLFHPPMVEAKKLVADGAIGKFIGMRIYLSDPKEEMIMREHYWIHKLPGGLLGETCPHAVYLSLAFMDKVNSVDVFAKRILEHPWAKFDEFRIELEGEKSMSSVMISYSSNRYNATVDILGTDGALSLDLQSMLVYRYGAKESLRPLVLARNSLSMIGQTVSGLVGNAVKMGMGQVRLGHDTVIERFVDSVLTDTKPPVTGEEGRDVVRVMEMIVQGLYEKYGS